MSAVMAVATCRAVSLPGTGSNWLLWPTPQANTESVGALFAAFVGYFAFVFDSTHTVVSVRVRAADVVTKRMVSVACMYVMNMCVCARPVVSAIQGLRCRP